MPITKKIEEDEKEIEKKHREFINKGGSVASDKKAKGDFTNVLIRVPVSILERVDRCVERKPWMNRTQWILEAIDKKLEEEF